MLKSGQIQYFLGANAPGGFYSLYGELLSPETARAVYILKGGPGCGKSTLMKQVAERAAQAGEAVEYVLCSGDPGSLDAVVFPRLGAALVDGTAPHGSVPQGRFRPPVNGTAPPFLRHSEALKGPWESASLCGKYGLPRRACGPPRNDGKRHGGGLRKSPPSVTAYAVTAPPQGGSQRLAACLFAFPSLPPAGGRL